MRPTNRSRSPPHRQQWSSNRNEGDDHDISPSVSRTSRSSTDGSDTSVLRYERMDFVEVVALLQQLHILDEDVQDVLPIVSHATRGAINRFEWPRVDVLYLNGDRVHDLSLWAQLTNVAVVTLMNMPNLRRLNGLCSRVVRLELQVLPLLQSLNPVTWLIHIHELELTQCNSLTYIPAISSLRELVVDTCNRLICVEFTDAMVTIRIDTCPQLQTVRWCGTDIIHLTELYIKKCERLQIVPSLRTCTTLNLLSTSPHNVLTTIQRASNLHTLHLDNVILPVVPVNLHFVRHCVHLTCLMLHNIPIQSLDGLPHTLVDIVLSDIISLNNITAVSACCDLRRVIIRHCPRVAELSALAFCTNLNSLVLTDTSVSNIDFVASLPILTSLELTQNTWLVDGVDIVLEHSSVSVVILENDSPWLTHFDRPTFNIYHRYRVNVCRIERITS